MDTADSVYLGVWTNWSRGSAVMGATLTTTREYGNLLIAFTAFFIPFVASRFWRIFAIIFHQYYSTPDPRDAVHHQRQVLLRNSHSPESGLVSFIRLMWAWRREGWSAWLRVLPVCLFLLCSICVFTVAGGFSSQISTAGEVLLKGDTCELAGLGAENATLWNAQLSYWSAYNNNLKNYAQSCYSHSSSNLLECSRFVASTISTATMDYNAPCPFKAGSCMRNNSNIRFDTGHLNSNDIFGLNAPKEETLEFRFVLQCAPLATEGRTYNITNKNRNFTAYTYGPQPLMLNNYTYAVPDIETQYAKAGQGLTGSSNFLLSASTFIPNNGQNETSGIHLDPSIDEGTGEVTLFFLSGNGVHFMSHTDDDWYRATVPAGVAYTPGDPDPIIWYRPSEAASPMGCIQQTQWCRDPALGECGSLGASTDALFSAAPWFGLTREDWNAERPVSQNKLASLLLWAHFMQSQSGAGLFRIVETLGPASLASQRLIQSGQLDATEKNLWQTDVTQWWYILLASFQSLYVTTAQGTLDSSDGLDTYKPASKWEWEFCHNQKIRSAQYSSFSIFGLVFTYIIGAIIVIISFLVEPILCLLQKRSRYGKYSYLEWEGDTAIQLHRLAQDHLGHGQWTECDTAVPVTQPGDLLAPFDIMDPRHPMLVREIDVTCESISPKNDRRSSFNKETLQGYYAENNSERPFASIHRGNQYSRSNGNGETLKTRVQRRNTWS